MTSSATHARPGPTDATLADAGHRASRRRRWPLSRARLSSVLVACAVLASAALAPAVALAQPGSPPPNALAIVGTPVASPSPGASPLPLPLLAVPPPLTT